jgi:tyrosine-protein kinase Etk/Wzc
MRADKLPKSEFRLESMPLDVSPSKPQEHSETSGVASASARVTESNETSLLDLVVVLVGRKRIILSVTAVFAVVAIIVSLVVSPRYTATVTLLPPQQNSSVGAALASQLGNMGGVGALAGSGLGLKNQNDMFVALFKSRTVEDAIVQHFGLMQEYRVKYPSIARKTFETHASVDGSGKDGLIRISVEDRDPRRAADLANGYVDQFRIQSQHLAITEASQRRLFFEQQLEQAKDSLANAEEAMKQTEQKTGMIQLDSQARALIESASLLRAQINAKEVQIQGMQTYATGENSQVVEAQQELASLRSQLAKLGGSEDSIGELIVPKGKVPEAGLEYIRKLRDVKYNETIFEILARQFEVAKLDEAKQGALVQVVDPAVAPDLKSFPKRSLIVIGATAVGFLIGILVALFQFGFTRLRDDPEASGKLAFVKKELFFK